MRFDLLFSIALVGALALSPLPGAALRAQSAAVPNSAPQPPVAPTVSGVPTVRRAAAVTPAPSAGPSQNSLSQNIPSDLIAAAIYAVAPEDVVDVKVFEEPDLETTARVGKDGTINFPLIGTVAIAGKTPDEAARVIGGELAKDYLVNPQVTITVVEYAKRTFTVLGEVQKPGSYDMPDRRSLTLLEAIGAAGGYTRIADAGKIRLKRLEGGKETIFKLDAKSMATERQTASFEVKPGDIITVGETFF